MKYLHDQKSMSEALILCAFRALVGKVSLNMSDVYLSYGYDTKKIHLRYYFYNVKNMLDNQYIEAFKNAMMQRCGEYIDSFEVDCRVGFVPHGKQERLDFPIFSTRIWE